MAFAGPGRTCWSQVSAWRPPRASTRSWPWACRGPWSAQPAILACRSSVTWGGIRDGCSWMIPANDSPYAACWTCCSAASSHEPRLRLDRLAHQAGLSTSHVSHQFRRHLGVSPKRWILRRRMASARALLLAQPHTSIAEVAERCGFGDPYQFSRTFSRRMGCPPSVWRRRMNEPEPLRTVSDPAPVSGRS